MKISNEDKYQLSRNKKLSIERKLLEIRRKALSLSKQELELKERIVKLEKETKYNCTHEYENRETSIEFIPAIYSKCKICGWNDYY